jgi:hypothetical protein
LFALIQDKVPRWDHGLGTQELVLLLQQVPDAAASIVQLGQLALMMTMEMPQQYMIQEKREK